MANRAGDKNFRPLTMLISVAESRFSQTPRKDAFWTVSYHSDLDVLVVVKMRFEFDLCSSPLFLMQTKYPFIFPVRLYQQTLPMTVVIATNDWVISLYKRYQCLINKLCPHKQATLLVVNLAAGHGCEFVQYYHKKSHPRK